MSPPIEQRLADLHEHYVRRINASLATGRLDLIRELADEYEDESLHLMLSPPDGTPSQLDCRPVDMLEFGGRTPRGLRNNWFRRYATRRRQRADGTSCDGPGTV